MMSVTKKTLYMTEPAAILKCSAGSTLLNEGTMTSRCFNVGNAMAAVTPLITTEPNQSERKSQ